MTALVNTRQNVSSLDLVQQFAVVAVPVVAHWQTGWCLRFIGEWAGCQTKRGTACVKRLACSSSAAAAAADSAPAMRSVA